MKAVLKPFSRWTAAPAIILAGLFLAGPSFAQSLNFAAGKSGLPIEIQADNGIEWQQGKLIFLAKGNARAVRGDVTITADTLRAYYREIKGGKTEIFRLDAEGNVKIASPTETATGGKATYDVDNAILVLSGGRVRLVSGQDKIEADKQLEYWERKQMAVARGNAVAIRYENKQVKTLRADVLAAYFKKNKEGKSSVHRVEAFDNVRIDTDKDKVLADRSVYNVESGIATLTGSVKIFRNGNELQGCSAKVNLNTGISSLFGCGPGAKGAKRVRGLILPTKKKR